MLSQIRLYFFNVRPIREAGMYVMLSLTCQYQSILFFTLFINLPSMVMQRKKWYEKVSVFRKRNSSATDMPSGIEILSV
jgi:hypothetical protein